MESVLKKAGFNVTVKSGLLRRAVTLIPDLAQFEIYRGSSTHDEFRKSVKEYDKNRTEYRTAGRLLKRGTGASKSGSNSEKPIEEKLTNSSNDWLISHY